MKKKIIKIEKGIEAVIIPEEFLRELELIPGSEVEVILDREKRLIIIKPLSGDPFIEHFKDSMESMA